MNTNCMSRYLSILTLFIVFFAPYANALELTGNVSTELEYTNNSALDSTQTQDDVSQRVGLDLNVLENRKSVQASANFRVESEKYYNDSFSDRASLTAGFGLFNLDLIESFLNWQTSLTRTEVLTDASDTNTPDNREYRNILRTGPTVSYQYSSKSLLALNVNFIGVENSEQDASDTQRVNGTLNFKYLFSPMTGFNINSQYQEILDIDSDSDTDSDEEYDNIKLSIGLVRRFFLGDFQFNLGRTRLTPDQSDATESNFFDIQLNRDQLFRHDVSLTYLEDISDTSIGFESDEEGAAQQSDSQRSTSGSDVIKRKRIDVSATRVFGNTNYAIKGFWENESFVVLDRDERSVGFSLGINHNLSQRLISEFEYTYEINDFVGRVELGKDKESTYRVGGVYRLSADMRVNGFTRFSSRYNSQNMSREYEEFSVGFGFIWSFL